MLDPSAMVELKALGYMSTPVIVLDGEVVVGFDRGRLKRILGLR